MQKIKFYPMNDIYANFLDKPKPASSFLPKWYKDMPNFADGQDRHGIHKDYGSEANTTVKHCAPFLDALTMGYVWSLAVDIEVLREGDSFHFGWRPSGDFVTSHIESQHPGLPAVADGESFVMKWSFDYKIVTPKGYSTLFTHPFNRNDLPFRTFTGVVETDSFELPVQFPFQLISKNIGESLIIPKGTPVVQMIPFKRDNWKSELGNYDPLAAERGWFNLSSTIVKSYKNNYWKKKKYV
jgi:hypothetical protein